RRARAVHDAPWHDEALERLELDRAVLEVDEEAALEHEEELVVLVVLVPVVLTLEDAEADDRVVHLAERLVVPGVVALRDERGHVDDAQGRELDVEVRRVGIGLRLTHGRCSSISARPRAPATTAI